MGRNSSKYDKAYNYLMDMISEDLVIGDKLPTESTIAAKLKINRMTVSKAMATLNGKGHIERRQGYGTTLINKPLRRHADTVLVLSPSPLRIAPKADFNDYYGELLKSIQYECLSRGLMTLCIPCQDISGGPINLSEIDNLYDPECVKGIIVSDSYINAHEKLLEVLSDKECGVVWSGMSQEDAKNINTVDADDSGGAFVLTEELIAHGCRKILILSFAVCSCTRKRRIDGAKKALAAAGIEVDERYILAGSEFSSASECGRECAGIYAARKLKADGVLLIDYPVYKGFIEFCDEFKLSRVKNLPVAAFDCPTDYSPNLVATARLPVSQIGTEMVKMLCSLFDDNSKQLRHKVLPIEIIKAHQAAVAG
jgi:DNA-binding LacI/PurR family transcriptional regulator